MQRINRRNPAGMRREQTERPRHFIRKAPFPIGVAVGAGPWTGKVMLAEHLGSDTFLKVDAGDLGILTVRAPGEVHVGHGDQITFGPQAAKIHRFGADGKAIV